MLTFSVSSETLSVMPQLTDAKRDEKLLFGV